MVAMTASELPVDADEADLEAMDDDSDEYGEEEQEEEEEEEEEDGEEAMQNGSEDEDDDGDEDEEDEEMEVDAPAPARKQSGKPLTNIETTVKVCCVLAVYLTPAAPRSSRGCACTAQGAAVRRGGRIHDASQQGELLIMQIVACLWLCCADADGAGS